MPDENKKMMSIKMNGNLPMSAKTLEEDLSI